LKPSQQEFFIQRILHYLSTKKQLFFADKLLLTIAEAQTLTGLSRDFLKDAITAGDLKAKVIGKSWRVKRVDVQEYVDKLFGISPNCDNVKLANGIEQV
jgi:excisionase family DNA binding protein